MLDSIVDKSLISVDWDARTLRIVQARAKGKRVTVDQVLAVPIPADVRVDEIESMGAFLGQALSKAGIKTKTAVVDIPRERVNFHTLNLPRVSIDDTAGMVAFQVPKELHFPIDQAAVDFTIPPELDDESETHDVLVAAVRHEEVDFYKQVFKTAGLKLVRVGLRPNANQFAVNELLKNNPHKHVLFVDVGPLTTEIDILCDGHLVFSRAADVELPAELVVPEAPTATSTPEADLGAGEDEGLSLIVTSEPEATTLERAKKALMIEVTRSIEAYKVGNPAAVLDHAVIGGSSEIEEALAEAIERQYHITAQPYNPAKCFGWNADQGAAAGAFAAALGLVLAQTQDSSLRFNFLDPKRPISVAERRVKSAPLAAAVVALFLIAGGVVYVQMIKPQHDRRAELEVAISEVEDELDSQKDFIELVKTLRDYEAHRIVWIDTLYDLAGTLPDQQKFVLSRIGLSQKSRSIKLPFRAREMNVGHGAARALEAFHPADRKEPVFAAKLGGTSTKERDDYSYIGTLTVNVADVQDRDDGKRKTKGR